MREMANELHLKRAIAHVADAISKVAQVATRQPEGRSVAHHALLGDGDVTDAEMMVAAIATVIIEPEKLSRMMVSLAFRLAGSYGNGILHEVQTGAGW